MAPPIIFHECPGGGGHLWARLNPRWYTDAQNHQALKRWCPDHEEEKKQHISAAISASRKIQVAAYDALALPSTKRCTNPEPTTHLPGAVLASGKFYRRTSAERVDGSKSVVLDSQCKECRKEEIKRRRAEMDPDKLRAQRAQWQRNMRKRNRKQRKKLRHQRDTQLEVRPFRVWLIHVKEANFLTNQALCEILGVDEATTRRIMDHSSKRKFVAMSIVDRAATAFDDPGMPLRLYPLSSAEGPPGGPPSTGAGVHGPSE